MADSKGKQTKFDMIIGATDRFSGVFKTFNDRMDKGSAKINRMQKSVQGLSRATGLSRLTASVGGVASSMRNVAKEGKALVSGIAGFVGKASLLFGGFGAGLMGLAKATANAGNAAADAAARAGVGLSTWQEYAHAANLSGVGNEQLEKSFRSLQDISIKAFKGDKTQASLLKMAGIDPKTAKGEIKNADSIMLELADKVKALRDSGQDAKAVNLVKSLFGDQGAKLMPMLQNGAEGLKKMRMEAHDLGLVFSGEDAAASSAFNTGLAKLSATFKGLGYSVGKVILPPVTKLIDKFSAWASGGREIIGTGFAEWVGSIDIDALWQSIESGLNTLKDLGKTINNVVQRFGGWKNVAIAAAAIISGKFLFSIAQLLIALSKMKLAMLTTPVGLLTVALMALAGVAYAIYKNWDGIVAYFQGLWQGVKDAFSNNWMDGVIAFLWDFNPLRLILKGMNELIAYFTGINLMEYGAKIVDSFGEGLSGAWASLMDWFMGKLKWFTDKWSKVKSLFGFGDSEAPGMSTDDGGEGWKGSGMGSPLNMGGDVKSVAETRSEHVEKEEIELTVRAADGASVTATRSGGRSGSNMSMQTGQQAMAGS